MIHYHGTPIGGTRAAAEEFASRRSLLIPWKSPQDLERVMELSRSFMVDNSAFTFWSTGEKPDWIKYVQWCKTFARHPRFDFAIIPDVIDGSEEDNNQLIRIWDRNCHAGIVVAGAPVWHLHESIGRLVMLAKRWPRICMGSSGGYEPGVGHWWGRMDEAFEAICEDGYPITKVHGLRMLRKDIIERYPFASCDSTNAVQNGTREAMKNGVDSSWGRMTIARRIEAAQSPSKFVKAEKQLELFAGVEFI
jgi:hypothetical protein